MRREVRRARISVTRHGVPLVKRIPSIRVSQGHVADVHLIARDDVGNPVDLTQYGVSSDSVSELGETTLKIRIVESVRRTEGYVEVEADPIDAANGEVHFGLTADHTNVGGIFLCELIVQDEGSTVFGYTFYLSVDPSPGAGCMHGPPTEAEIRLHMRDSMPDENYLIDELDFDLAEISLSISRPIQYWNEVPPPIGTYDTTTFPHRYHWLEAIVANLCFIAAEHYRRNRLTHTAAGVMIDDMNKEQNYQQEGMRRWQDYKTWVTSKKAEINIAMCYGTFGGSGYW